jgi:hypothetical protein
MIGTIFFSIFCLFLSFVGGNNNDYVPLFEYDYIIDDGTALMSLDISRVESFQTFPLTFMAFKKWGELSLLRRIPYLVDKYYLITAKGEFQNLMRQPSAEFHHLNDVFDRSQLSQQLQDYQTEKNLSNFWKTCDKNKDEVVEWIEYVVCRGYFDQQGNENDISEFDLLDGALREDFAMKLNNPTDPMVLYLLDKGVL